MLSGSLQPTRVADRESVVVGVVVLRVQSVIDGGVLAMASTFELTVLPVSILSSAVQLT